MGESRRKFDRDFREGAVRLVRETGRPIAQVARATRPGRFRHRQADVPSTHGMSAPCHGCRSAHENATDGGAWFLAASLSRPIGEPGAGRFGVSGCSGPVPAPQRAARRTGPAPGQGPAAPG